MYLQYQPAKMEVEAEFDSVQFNVGQGLVHSMSRAVSKWMNIHSPRHQQDIIEYYVVCNSTQQFLCFGQVYNTIVTHNAVCSKKFQFILCTVLTEHVTLLTGYKKGCI